MDSSRTEPVLLSFAPRWPVSHARKEEIAFRDCVGEGFIFLLEFKTSPLEGQTQRYSQGSEGHSYVRYRRVYVRT